MRLLLSDVSAEHFCSFWFDFGPFSDTLVYSQLLVMYVHCSVLGVYSESVKGVFLLCCTATFKPQSQKYPNHIVLHSYLNKRTKVLITNNFIQVSKLLLVKPACVLHRVTDTLLLVHR